MFALVALYAIIFCIWEYYEVDFLGQWHFFFDRVDIRLVPWSFGKLGRDGRP